MTIYTLPLTCVLVPAEAGSSQTEGEVVSKPRAGVVRERGTHLDTVDISTDIIDISTPHQV